MSIKIQLPDTTILTIECEGKSEIELESRVKEILGSGWKVEKKGNKYYANKI